MILQSNSILNFGPITTAIIFGIIQALFILYFFSKNKRYKPHLFFTCTIVVLLIMMIESFFLQSGYLAKYPHVFGISIPLIFLIGPFTLFYVATQLGIKRSKFRWLHFIPFVFYFIYSFNLFLQNASFKRGIYLESFRPDHFQGFADANFSPDPFGIQGWVVVELLSLHLFVYGVIVFSTIVSQKNKAGPKPKQEKLAWLFYLNVILLLAAFVLFFSQGGVIRGHVFFESPFPKYSADLFSVCAIYLMTAYILGKADYFKAITKKYSKSTLSPYYKKEKLKQLKLLIETEKLYLNPEFSLKLLSEKSKISPHNISQILNEELQSNFNELTNSYRIDEAKNRLLNGDLKVEQLAYELGYKSKSTFFNAFKKATQMTPSEFRKQH